MKSIKIAVPIRIMWDPNANNGLGAEVDVDEITITEEDAHKLVHDVDRKIHEIMDDNHTIVKILLGFVEYETLRWYILQTLTHPMTHTGGDPGSLAFRGIPLGHFYEEGIAFELSRGRMHREEPEGPSEFMEELKKL